MQDGSACINKCNEHSGDLATAEYPDYFTDPATPQCKFCKDKDANCIDCYYDTAVAAGTDGWKCLLCENSNYLAVDKKSCVADCYADDNSHYPIYIKDATDIAYYMCIAECFDDNENFARDTTGSDGWQCVWECESTEYLKVNTVTPKYVCTLCSARKDDGGADDSYFENCNA